MDSEQESSERGPARSGPRASLFLLTHLRSPQGGDLGRARIRNLSATGLMADCEQHIDVGTELELNLRGVGPIRGAVVWVKGDRIGVSFDRRIDPQLVRKPVGTPVKPSLPDYLRTHPISRTRAPRRD